MATARDTIKGALRLIGVIASGETPTAAEQTDGLQALNEMLQSWSAEGLLVPAVTREELTLIPAQSAYTIGVGGNFATSVPVAIDSVMLKSGAQEYPMRQLSRVEWAEISLKGLQGTIPEAIYFQKGSPLGTINVYPVPSAAHKLVLYSQKSMGTFTSANDDVNFPAGYAEALRYNLAVRLAPEYGRAIGPEVLGIAQDAKANIQRQNSEAVYMTTDAPIRGRAFDFDTGE